MEQTTKKRGRPPMVTTVGAIHFCSSCPTAVATEQELADKFYKSTSKLFARNTRVCMCKNCIQIHGTNDDGGFNMDKFKDVLHFIDKPLIFEVFNSSVQETLKVLAKDGVMNSDEVYEKHGKRLIQIYMKNIALPQNISKNYHDSDLFQEVKTTTDLYSTEKQKSDEEEAERLRDRWGNNYDIAELRRFENKCKKLLPSYKKLNRGMTDIHEDMFMQWVKYSILSDMALENGDDKRAKELSDMATKAATNAKMNPSQFKAEDFTEGINAFADYTKMAEKAVDIIPILPQFKFRPNDAIDFLMWNYVNYERNLNGMPDVEYKDMWKEYDTRKDSYIKTTGDPYNIFEGDTTEGNREKILKFLEMPADLENYDEQDTEEGEENFE